MITLKNKNASLKINTKQGGRIQSLNIAGMELLVKNNGNPLGWGCYPMAPWVGRLRQGLFHFQNKQHHFTLNLEQHALHGTCLERAWQLDHQDSSSVELHIDLGSEWPFRGKAKQRLQLNSNSLQLTLEVHSESQAFPASLGWHPWFLRQLASGQAAQIEFSAEKKYACDSEQIPTGELIAPGKGPWDDCFIGVKKDPVIHWPGALQLRMQSSASHWVVYNQPEHAFCIEPQTAQPNALNFQVEANYPDTQIVTPDHPLVLHSEWFW